jgi:hypothetical protein
MKLRRSLGLLMLPIAVLAVVFSLDSFAQVSSAQPTVTVYKNPT